MAQYKIGTVTVTNGDATVVGIGTSWLAEINVGDWFSLQGQGHARYEVLSKTSDTELELSTLYAGTTAAGALYAIVRDFTLLSGYPIINEGDVDTHRMMGRFVSMVDGNLVTDHTALSNIGTTSHAGLDLHVGDATLHFTEASIDHTAILNIGITSHADLDLHVGDATLHFTSIGGCDDVNLTGLNDGDILAYNLSTGDFEPVPEPTGVTDHTLLSNIGTTTHADLDTFYNSLIGNAYNDGTWKYLTTDKAGKIEFDVGDLTIQTAKSGTIDTAITWANTLRASSSINNAPTLSVGKTTIEDWGATYTALQVGGNASLFTLTAESGGNRTYLGQNIYFSNTFRPISTGLSSYYLQQSGQHMFHCAVSTTADAGVNVEEMVRIGRSQYGSEVLSVGKNQIEAWSNNFSVLQIGGNSAIGAEQVEGASKSLHIYQNAMFTTGYKYVSTDEASYYRQAFGAHVWYTAQVGTANSAITWEEVMRTDLSGALVLGKFSTDITTAGIEFAKVGSGGFTVDGGVCLKVNRLTSDGTLVEFYQDSTVEGSISISATTTSYNTTSDYRLKENIVDIDNAIERLKLLKPYRFNFKTHPQNVVDGFIAHEVQEVLPMAVHGIKDAVDDDGDAIMQQMDASKLIPMMVAAIQELSDKNDALMARIEALENT